MSAPAVSETLLEKKRFLLCPLYRISPKITRRREQSKGTSACRISTPGKGKSISDQGVGVDCLFLVGRLAMPCIR